MSIFSKVITSVFGKKSDKDLKKILPIVEEINIKYESLSELSDDDLKLEFQKIKDNLQLLISSNKDKYLNDRKDANTIDDPKSFWNIIKIEGKEIKITNFKISLFFLIFISISLINFATAKEVASFAKSVG